MNNTIFALSSLGLVLSLYSLLIKSKIKDKNYRPFCDISKRISCSKAFSSKTGNLFKIHNSILGTIFYLVLIIFAFLEISQIIFYLSVISILFSIYLAFISYVKMKNFCIVCSAIYIINTLIFIFSIQYIK